MYIEGYGVRIAEDTGAYIKGDRMDLYVEFGMEWFSFGSNWSPRLGCFHDGFKALEVSGLIPDLYSLGDRVGFSPDTFKAFLLGHGFVDETDKHPELIYNSIIKHGGLP